MEFDPYGYPIFPGDRGYSCCCGDVDRFERTTDMGGFRNYDAWKLASPDDEADEAERKRLRKQSLEDLADDEYDRKKDEAAEDDYRNYPAGD